MTRTLSEMNPYDPVKDPKRWNVAELLLSGTTVSWDDLREVAGGKLSPRTFGFILRDLEEREQATILRLRDPEYGTLYRYDPEVAYDERFRLAKADGPDAQRHLARIEAEGTGDPETSVDASASPGATKASTSDPGAPEKPHDPLGDVLEGLGMDEVTLNTILDDTDTVGPTAYGETAGEKEQGTET